MICSLLRIVGNIFGVLTMDC
uniref:Uncharacterized protein n=1 Tax=Anguilla anguilla TaxID=7936 RepID=A0A0E9SLK0_ANGAN